MPVNQVCCLCRTTSSEYNLLQTYMDEFNKIYDITLKYFDPMLLTQDESTNSQHNQVLCQDCWFYINKFHEFQRKVLQNRKLWEDKSKLKTWLIEVKQEIKQANVDKSNILDNGNLDKTQDVEDTLFINNLECRDLKTETLASCGITLAPILVEELIQTNVPTSNTSDNGRLDITQDDEYTLFMNNVECRDLKTESLTSCGNTIESTLAQEAIQLNVPPSNTPDNGYLDKNKDGDNLFEYNIEYGDFKTESPTRSENNFESILKNTDEKEENSLVPEEDMNSDEQNLKTAKRKLRKRKNSRNDTKHSERIKKPKVTEDTKGAAKTSCNKERTREPDAIIAEWKSELICDLCNETATNFYKLRSHFKEKHKTKLYIKCCERKFYRRQALVEHVELHLNPETHKCDICGKSSTNKYVLKKHQKAMHGDKDQWKCDICEKTFRRKGNLDLHLFTHSTKSKDFICSECGKGFFTKRFLKIHIKQVHNDDHVCDQCGKNIHGSQTFKIHLMEHAGIERPSFPCDVCGIKLQTVYGLRRHKKACHNDDPTIYVCGVCGKVSTTEYSLLMHKKSVHAAERQHKCTLCDKSFTRPAYLREHIATHTGEDLYQCPHCPQKFKVNTKMHRHRKRKHPVEWAEARKTIRQFPRINNNQDKKHIAIYLIYKKYIKKLKNKF